MCVQPQGEVGGPGQKGSKGDKGELVSFYCPVYLIIFYIRVRLKALNIKLHYKLSD